MVNNPSIRTLTLTIVDNAFNAEKARTIYDVIAGTQLSGFTL